jgi:hypothetical protein
MIDDEAAVTGKEPAMRGKGINYDTGFCPGGESSREQFDAGVVRGEMRVIARDLHCPGSASSWLSKEITFCSTALAIPGKPKRTV